MPSEQQNVDPREVARFSELAHAWWDPNGEFRTLHDINTARLDFVDTHAVVSGKRILDVGCGGGLLSEAMAARGGHVTGVDASETAVEVARLHLLESGLDVDYQTTTAEALQAAGEGGYDIVTCMELLEHVPEPATLVDACTRLVRPGGAVFFSTINRTPRSWMLAVVGAEYVLGLVPKGTHSYEKLVRPSELDAWGRAAGLDLRALSGLLYNPFSHRARLGADVGVNYLAWFTRPEDA